MNNIKELADAIDRDRLQRARDRRPMLKLLDGFELFNDVCQRMRAGVRLAYPQANDAEVERLLRERIDRIRQIEESGLYHPVEEEDS